MANITLPFVNSFTDSRGKRRHQFRRKGHKGKPTIKGRAGSQEFMDHYHALVDQTGGTLVAEAGSSRIKAGTIDATVARYYVHDSFKVLAEVSRKMRRREIDKFRNFLTPGGHRYGDNRFRMMAPRQVDNFCEGESQSIVEDRIKALRHLFKFAITQGEMTVDPSLHIQRATFKSKGHMTWKLQPVEMYRARHPVGTMARVAIELMLNIAARRTDVYQIGRPHMMFDAERQMSILTWRPSKTSRSTGKVLSIPVLPLLQEALDAMAKSMALTFLTDDKGMPFKNANAFGTQFAKWCNEAGLPAVLCADGKTRNYRAHGLRKAALYTLWKLGATPAMLQSIGGQSSLAELQKYIAEVEQDEMAVAAMALVANVQKLQIKDRAKA